MASRLDGLATRLHRWSIRASTALDQARRAQRAADERDEQLRRTAAQLDDETHRAQQTVDQLSQAVQEASDEAIALASGIGQLGSVTANVADTVQKARNWWEGELSRARDSLRDAEQELHQWRMTTQRAIQEAGQAETAVESARRALSACQRDDNRRNCNREAQYLADAEHRLHEALQFRAHCEDQVRTWTGAVSDAEAEVDCCEGALRSVATAEQHVTAAESEHASADDEMGRAQAHVKAADASVAEAREGVDRLASLAETVNQHTQQHARETQQAHMAQAKASAEGETAQNLAHGGRRETRQAAARLRELARVRL